MRSAFRLHVMVALTALVLGLPVGVRAESIYKLSLDTSAIAGQTFWVEFDLIDGDGVKNNTAVISGLAGSTAITDAGSPVLTNDASGNLSSKATLGDSSFFNAFDQRVTFGSFFDVFVTLDPKSVGPTPDSLSFFLLRDNPVTGVLEPATDLPITTSDPTGADSLLFVNLRNGSIDSQSYSADALGGASPTFQEFSAVVPEPAALALAAQAGILTLAGWCLRHRARARTGA